METQANLEKILGQIESDRKNGATYLARLSLDALDVFATSLHMDACEVESSVSSILTLVERIGEIRPSMAAIRTQGMITYRRMERLVEQGMSVPDALLSAVAKDRKNLLEADRVIAEIAFDEMGPAGVIVTCSWSDTVKIVIGKLRPALLLIGEGHPLGDGVRAAKWFNSNGFKVEVVSDGALPTAVEGASAVLIGADQVLADGRVVNRCSSLSLALSASHFEVPFFVACQRIKFSGQTSVTIEEYRQCDDKNGEVLKRVPMFDVTPAKLVKKIFSEIGAMTPIQAGKVGQEGSY